MKSSIRQKNQCFQKRASFVIFGNGNFLIDENNIFIDLIEKLESSVFRTTVISRKRFLQEKNVERLLNSYSDKLHRSSDLKYLKKHWSIIDVFFLFLSATARRDYDEVRYLLQTGHYHPNAANEDGLTPMHQCAIDNSEQLLMLLIEYGGDVNIKDRDLWTPLHAAGREKSMPCFHCLFSSPRMP